MSSNLKVNTILPSTGTTIGIGTVGGLINVVGNIDVNSTSGISTFNGLEISGIVTAKAGAAVTYYGDGSNLTGITDNVVTINNNADNRLITGSGTANTLEAESTLTYDGTNLDLGDSKNIRLGASQDLQLYHNGTNSFLTNATGYLLVNSTGGDNVIRSNTNVYLQPASGESGVTAIANGAVELYHDNTKRFNTISNGCEVQGRLGVGDGTDPETTFQVTATAAGAQYPMLLKNRTNGNAAVGMRFIATGADLSDGDFASIEAGHGAVGSTNHEFRFKTCHSGTVAEKLRIRSSGGITFNGDSAAANALDDYEEGSFTPTLTGGGSLTNSGSYYTKIGRFINFYCYITALNIPNNNNAFVVSGLPYVVASGTFGGPCSVSYAGSANDSRIANIAPNVQSGNNYIYFHSVGIGQGYTMNNAHFQVMVNGNLNIQGCYITTT